MKCYFILLWFGWQDGLTSEKSVVFKVEQRSITFTLVYNARFWLIFYWTLCGILYSALIDVVLQYNNFHYYGVWTLHTHTHTKHRTVSICGCAHFDVLYTLLIPVVKAKINPLMTGWRKYFHEIIIVVWKSGSWQPTSSWPHLVNRCLFWVPVWNGKRTENTQTLAVASTVGSVCTPYNKF